jgi:hypothetical protein
MSKASHCVRNGIQFEVAMVGSITVCCSYLNAKKLKKKKGKKATDEHLHEKVRGRYSEHLSRSEWCINDGTPVSTSSSDAH